MPDVIQRETEEIRGHPPDVSECVCCGNVIEGEVFNSVDGDLCEECMDNYYYTCEGCYDLVYHSTCQCLRDKIYCDSCVDNLFTTCHGCGELVEDGDVITSDIEGEPYCENCHNERFTYCERCECELERSSSYTYYNADGAYCEECFRNINVECYGCGEAVEREDSYRANGRYYCQECYEDITTSTIKNYSYKPSPRFHKRRYENTLYLGVELEVYVPENKGIEESARKLRKWLSPYQSDNLYFKHDASLENGFEIVSHPHTLLAHKSKIRWYAILKHMRKKKYTSYNNGHCGIHVHLSRDHFTGHELNKLKLFFSSCRTSIKKFSFRRGRNENYCPYENYTSVMLSRTMLNCRASCQ